MSVEEGLLKDVLDELDRERSKRADLEAEIRQLNDEKRELELRNEGVVSAAEHTKLQTESDGYKDLVDALTARRPAVVANNAVTTKQIPPHILRLLEVMPWDARTQQYIKVTEQVYEWQVFRDGVWQSHLRHFPINFRTLKLFKSTKKDTMFDFMNAADMRKGTCSVLTNEVVTRRFDIENGCPIADAGTWEWIGSWAVHTEFCDTDGWCYAKQPKDFLEDSDVWDHSGTNLRTFRRRQWTRQRVLVGYEHACEPTLQYLKLMARNAELEAANANLGEELAEAKSGITNRTGRILEFNNKEDGLSDHRPKFAKRMDSFFQPRKPSDDLTTTDESIASLASDDADRFDWKKLKNGLTFKAPKRTGNIFRRANSSGDPLL